MARVTKLELEQRLSAMGKELEAARLRISQLEGELAMKSRIGAHRTGRIVSTYINRDGVRMNKVEIGFNTYAHRPAH